MPCEKVIDTIKHCLQQLDDKFPGYVRRESQIKMMNDICHLLDKEKTEDVPCNVLVQELPTGTGKGLGYSISALPIAKKHDRKLVISTATIALQQQLAEEDLPLLVSIYPEPITFAVAKGRQNFVCDETLKKLMQTEQGEDEQEELFAADQAMLTTKPTETDLLILRQMMKALEEKKWDGDFQNWHGKTLRREIQRTIMSDPHRCKRRFAGHKQCAFHRQRQKVYAADIVVANHALVAMDLKLGSGRLLPPVTESIYVFDECHALPKVVRDATASIMNVQGFTSIIESLIAANKRSRFTKALDKSKAYEEPLSKAANLVLLDMKPILDFFIDLNAIETKEIYRFEKGIVPAVLETQLDNLKVSLLRVMKELGTIQKKLEDILLQAKTPLAEQNLSDIAFYSSKIEDSLSCVCLFLQHNNVGSQPAKWISIEHEPLRFSLNASEVTVADKFRDWLFDDHAGVILCSATIKALNSFDAFAYSMGLNTTPDAYFKSYPSPFNHNHQATLNIVNVPMDPTDEGFTQWVIEHIIDYIQLDASTLALFTSLNQMHTVADAIRDDLEKMGILLQCQGEASRERIIFFHKEHIKNQKKSVIFGVNSFSEGLDLKRELLTTLLIIKIPFESLTPLIEAEIEHVKDVGGNPFLSVSLPQASRALTQSCGRLIRTEECKGQIFIFDRRIKTKTYGRQLLDALPPFKISGM